MLHKRYRFLLVQDLKKTIRKYLEENPNCGKLSAFSYPGIIDSFFDPLLKINCMSMILPNYLTKILLYITLFAMPKDHLWQNGESLIIGKTCCKKTLKSQYFKIRYISQLFIVIINIPTKIVLHSFKKDFSYL